MRKFISLFLVIVLLFSIVLFSSCDNKTNENTEVAEDDKNIGTHNYSQTSTDDFVVENGKTDYYIVYPENASEDVIFAKDELISFFNEATGCKLNAFRDSSKTYSLDAKFISIGKTSFLQQANVDVDKSVLGRDGVRIKTVGKNIFITGAEDEGTIFSVYVLLERMFNYDCFYSDCYYIDTGITELKLVEYDIVDVPDFATRTPNMGYLWDNEILSRRMRYNDYFCYDEVFIQNPEKLGSNKSLSQHNSFYYLPPAYYNNSNDTDNYHPKWFSDCNASNKSGPAQLCYTAHGDESEYNKMKQEIFDVMKFNLMRDKESNIISLSMQDDFGNCTCDACNAIEAQYHSPSATVLLMVNDLAKMIDDWFNTSEGAEYKRDLKVGFMAYHCYELAPMIYNETTKEYDATLQGYYNNANGYTVETYVLYAPIFANYIKPMTDSDNATEYNNLIVWGKTCKSLSVWQYNTCFSSAGGYLIPLNTFNSQQANYQFYFKNNVNWIFSQGQHNQTSGATGWMILKTYLDSKLAWNCNIDYNKYINKFFDNYFGVASDEMKIVFNLYRSQAAEMENNGFNPSRTAFITSGQGGLDDANYWPQGTLEFWLSQYDKALEKIANLKTADLYSYNTLYKHIAMERVSVYYLLVKNYENADSNKVLSWKKQFKNDVNLIGITLMGESGNIGGLITDTWEI